MEAMTIEMQFPETKVREIVTEAIKAELDKRFPKTERNIPRIESAKAMGITVVTWDKRAIEGLFKTVKIGGKVFIRESEQSRILNQSRY